MSFFDIIIAFIYFILFPLYLIKNYPKFILLLFLYHTIFVFDYWYNLSLNCGADACFYWFITRSTLNSSHSWFSYFGLSSNFLLFINYPLVKFFKTDFLYGFFLYGIMGFLGIINLYKILKHYDYAKIKFFGISLYVLILFLPNMHFWTAAIGKDSLSFFCISYLFFHIIKYKNFNYKFLLTSFFLFLIRPHIAVFLLCSVGAAVILHNKKLPLSRRIFFGVIAAVIIPVLVSITLSYAHLDFDVDDISENFQSSQFALAAQASSAIPMTDYILPVKIFTFFFRPFIFDVHDGATFGLAVEDTFTFLFFIWALKLRFKWKLKPPYQMQAILFFTAINTIFYCYRDTNLGIIIRMKNMSFPFLLAYCFYVISYTKLAGYVKLKNLKNECYTP